MWTITKDHINLGETEGRVYGNFREGETGPASAAIVKHSKSQYFAVYDDDEVLYYEGYFNGQDEFQPLDYYMSNDGCTDIKYYNKEKELVSL